MINSSPPQTEGIVAILPLEFRGNLTEAEARVLKFAPMPDVYANCGSDSIRQANQRSVRAKLLRWICTDQAVRPLVDVGGLRVLGAEITGLLDLSFVNVSFPIRLVQCEFPDQPNLQYIKIPLLEFSGSSFLKGAIVDGAEVAGDVFLGKSTLGEKSLSKGTFRMAGARIGGDLDCQGGVFENPGGVALEVTDTRVGGNLFLSNRFSANGKVDISHCQIGDNLNCSGGTFSNPASNATALFARGMKVGGETLLFQKFACDGLVDMMSATFTGNLEFGGSFSNPGKTALLLQAAMTKNNVVFDEDFAANGEVDMEGIQVAGSLRCSGTFKNPGKEAFSINLDSAEIMESVYLSDAISTEGEVHLGGIRIDGDLDCSNGTFRNPQGQTIDADRARIKGSVFLRTYGGSKAGSSFSSYGEVNLVIAEIGGNLECDGGSFINQGSMALTANSAAIGGNVFLRNGFVAVGEVNFVGATIRNVIQCENGTFGDVDLHLASARELDWEEIKSAANFDLRDAKVEMLRDDIGSWNHTTTPKLNGFIYGTIFNNQIDSADRLKLIARQGGGKFTRQPYVQLASVLHNLGDDGGAEKVLGEMERRTREERREKLGSGPREWLQYGEDETYGVTVGYGVYPLNAVWWLVGLSAFGWIVFRRAKLQGAMAPTDKDAYGKYRATGKLPDSYPPFNPLVYSVENCIPIVKLGQDDRWQIDPHPKRAPLVLTPDAGRWRKIRFGLGLAARFLDSPSVLRWVRWILILLGWVLATFFVAGLTNSIRSDYQ